VTTIFVYKGGNGIAAMDSLFHSLMMGGGRRRTGGGKKKAKAKKNNWYERLNADEVKQIAKAANLKISGTKKELIERLLDHEPTNTYAWEGGSIGCTVDYVKGLCRERDLPVSGTKFQLVLRVVQHDHGTAPAPAGAAKRALKPHNAATAGDGNGDKPPPAKKPRKPAAPKPPQPDKIYTAVQKKIEMVHQKKYQSHWGSKTHSCDVYDKVESIMREHCEEKHWIEKDPKVALTVCRAALTSLTENFGTMQRPGYDDCGSLGMAASILEKAWGAAAPALSKDEKEETAEWVMDLHTTLDSYGHEAFGEIAQKLESDEEEEHEFGSEENEKLGDTKPSAIKPVAEASSMVNVSTGGNVSYL